MSTASPSDADLLDALVHALGFIKLSYDALRRLQLETATPADMVTVASAELVAARQATQDVLHLSMPMIKRLATVVSCGARPAVADAKIIVLRLEGGVVQRVTADAPCQVIVLDYDEDDANRVEVAHPDGSTAPVWIGWHQAEVDPRWVASVAALAD